MEGCKCKSPINTAAKFLNACQDGTSASVFWGMLRKNEIHSDK
jgi:hypothetical protein